MKKNISILFHFLGWAFFFISIFIDYPFRIVFELDRFYMHIIFTSLMAGFFYLIYFYLFPKFFNRKKIFIFLLINISIIIGLSFIVDEAFNKIIKHENFKHNPPIEMANKTFALKTFDNPPPPPPKERKGPKRNPSQGILFFSLIAALSISIKATSEWFKSERTKKELENEKLKSELNALKAQINPHFFFNVMNNLCSLARKKSDKTEEYIIRLSQIMRYSINSVNFEQISLEKDLEFIKDYIEILKLSYPEDSNIFFTIKGNYSNFNIAPMILFEFVENAFKHSNLHSKENYINIQIEILDGILTLETMNSISNIPKKFLLSESGTGIENTKKRLSLIYPSKHNLFIKKEQQVFYIKLMINLNNSI